MIVFIGHSDLLATLERADPEEALSPSIRAICRTLDAYDEQFFEEGDEPADDGDTGAWSLSDELALRADNANDDFFLYGDMS